MVKVSFVIYFSEVFFDLFVVFLDFLLELLNFFIGVNFMLEFEVVLVFLLIIILFEDDCLCFEVMGLLVGCGNILERFSDVLEF